MSPTMGAGRLPTISGSTGRPAAPLPGGELTVGRTIPSMETNESAQELDRYLFSDLGDDGDDVAVCVEHRKFLPCRACLHGSLAAVPYSSDRAVVEAVRSHYEPESDHVTLDVASVAEGLRVLTRRLEDAGAEPIGGGLGVDFGYGTHYENDTFGIRSYCWCEQPDCPWCLPCSCPEEANLYFLGDTPMTSADHQALSIEDFLRLDVTKVKNAELACEYCTGAKISAANFWHLPSGSTVSWYKYIGRGMQIELNTRWGEILLDSLSSIRTVSVEPTEPATPDRSVV
jgi:hypothetical protein